MPLQAPFTTKLKLHLKTAISRLRMLQSRDTALAKQTRRQMADLLSQGRYESAKIRVENIIRADLITELHELLELYCELLLARLSLLDQPAENGIDPGLEEAVRGIIYAAPRVEVRELNSARETLGTRYGKPFVESTMKGEGVSERVTKKLKVEAPPAQLVEDYLRAIAHTYGIKYGDDDQEEEDADGGAAQDDEASDGEGGGQKEPPLLAGGGDDLGSLSPPATLKGRSPLSIAPPSPSTERPEPKIKAPGKLVKDAESTPSKGKVGGKVPDVDDLAARFAQLKR